MTPPEVYSPSESTLVVMIGLPGSGKTTLARQFAPAAVISTDAIRAELFGDEAVQGPWLQVEARLTARLQTALLHHACQTTIYDATNAVRRQRRHFVQQARQMGFHPIYGCWLDVPLSVCLRRNQQRSRRVPEPVVQRMHRCLQGAPPQLQEGFDGLVRIACCGG
ncbi:MAG: AAA family ATPase [Cyanobacteria bacterium P01_A01_bin.135]